MTHKNDYTLIEDLSKQGLDAIPELIRVLINNVMQLERADHLKVNPKTRMTTPMRAVMVFDDRWECLAYTIPNWVKIQ